MAEFNLRGLIICIILIYGLLLFVKSTEFRYIGIVFISFSLFHVLLLLCKAVTCSWIPVIRSLIIAAAIILALYFAIVEFLIIRYPKDSSSESLDYIVVHGAKVYGSTPSPSLLDRLEQALAYMQLHEQTIAILTGAKWPLSDFSEAQCMYEWLTARGIDKNRLIIEDKATNTLENIRYSIDVIRARHNDRTTTIGLLTSDYHMYRTMYLARSESIESVALAVPTSRFFVRINFFIREAFAMTEIYLFGVEGL